MRPTVTIAALIAASPALAARCPQGQFFRVHLDVCVSLSSPLARPYVGAAGSLYKNRGETETATYTLNRDDKINTREADPPVAADPPADEVDKAACLMIPLLRAVEERWAAMLSPPVVETPRPDPWPSGTVLWVRQ
jgi:hypothetical protein